MSGKSLYLSKTENPCSLIGCTKYDKIEEIGVLLVIKHLSMQIRIMCMIFFSGKSLWTDNAKILNKTICKYDKKWQRVYKSYAMAIAAMPAQHLFHYYKVAVSW